MAAKKKAVTLSLDGRDVEITSPDKLYFPEIGVRKGEVVDYYLVVADAALRHVAGRPMILKRHVRGAHEKAFYQKRAPESRPEWVETVTLAFPSGRTADEVVVRDAAQLAWVVNLGCIDLNPHPVRADDLEHPDELRIDLDPVRGVAWSEVRAVAMVVRDVLEEHGLVGWPKTSGSRGIHVNVRLERGRWGFDDVRRAALAVAREVERRMPGRATSAWWKEEREGVFLDYNQNAKDRTTCSAWSVRPVPDARVSMPLTWDEVPTCEMTDWTIRTAIKRYHEVGDVAAGIDAAGGSLQRLLGLAAELEAEREARGEAPDGAWPPHYEKHEGEPERVQPSRAKKKTKGDGAAKKGKTSEVSPTGQRRSRFPLLVIGQSEDEAAAMAGLERWKARWPDVAAQLEPSDVLVDKMRGRSSVWTRVRVNLRHVPAAERPPQEALDPDDAPDLGAHGGHA